jgi:CheY-like chemotaxis protein
MVTNKRENLEVLARALGAENTVALEWAGKRSEALAAVAGNRPDLVVVDEYIGYLTNLEFIRQLVQVDAFVHTAAVSRLPRETFHEVAEGLGILAQLPPGPGVWEAERLLGLLETVTAP